jgi:hypothetical protein
MRGGGFSVFKPKGRKKYRIEFARPVQGKKTHAGYRDKTATVAKARQLLRDNERADAGLTVLGKTELNKPITEAVAAFLADLTRRGKSAATVLHRRKKILRAAEKASPPGSPSVTSAPTRSPPFSPPSPAPPPPTRIETASAGFAAGASQRARSLDRARTGE